MKNYWKQFYRDERGQVLILFSFMFLVLLGLIGLTVDVGYWYYKKENQQKAVDAGALAGVQTLLQGTQTAKSEAQNIAMKNEQTPTYSVIFPNSNVIEVAGTEQVPTFFAGVFGIKNVTINTTAIAKLSQLSSGTGMTPIAVQQQPFTYGQEYPLSDGPGGGSSGNYGFLDFYAIDPNPPADVHGNGANSLNWYIENPPTFSIHIGDQIPTKPGLNVGKVSSAIDYLLNKPVDSRCTSFSTAYNGCPRVMYTPIVDSLGHGRSDVTVVGFAAFYLEGYSQKQINGRFIQMVRPSDTTTNSGNSDYGVYSSQLIQ